MEEIKIVYEDEELLVIDKPAGITTTKENSKVDSVELWLEKNREQMKLSRSGIVHRLDIGTSGLLVVAKTEKALIDLKRQFKNRQTEKNYMALVEGNLPFEGEINMPILRSKYGFGKFGVHEDGKKAITKFRLIRRYKKLGKIYSLADIRILTGRTHQIRVHFSYLGWPIMGDRTYGGKREVKIPRPFLQAYRLKISHPEAGKELVWQLELSQDLRDILKEYEQI